MIAAAAKRREHRSEGGMETRLNRPGRNPDLKTRTTRWMNPSPSAAIQTIAHCSPACELRNLPPDYHAMGSSVEPIGLNPFWGTGDGIDAKNYEATLSGSSRTSSLVFTRPQRNAAMPIGHIDLDHNALEMQCAGIACSATTRFGYRHWITPASRPNSWCGTELANRNQTYGPGPREIVEKDGREGNYQKTHKTTD